MHPVKLNRSVERTDGPHALARVCRDFCLAGLLAVAPPALADSYTSNSSGVTGAWNTARWNNSADGPAYTSSFTTNNNVQFTSGTYTFSGMGASTDVGNITVGTNVTVNFSPGDSSNFRTGGNVRTLDIGTGGTLSFANQTIVGNSGTGFIKNGQGTVSFTKGGAYGGGFTLNAGTVVVGGDNVLGGSAGNTNTLLLKGGTLAASGSGVRTFTADAFRGGITIGGSVQFGSTANPSSGITFVNDVSLGNSATRTLTIGNGGAYTFSGVVSNTAATGLTIAAVSGQTGRITLSNATNTYSGPTTVQAGATLELSSPINTTTNNIPSSNKILVQDGGRLIVSNINGGIANGGTVFDLASGQTLANGTSTANPGAVTGAVRISSGSFLSPGDSGATGKLATSGAQYWDGGGTYQWDYNSAADHDAVTMGNLDLTGASAGNRFTVQVVAGGAVSSWTTIASSDVGATLSGFSASKFALPTGYAVRAWDNAAGTEILTSSFTGNYSIQVQSTPEPTTTVSFVAGAAAVALGRRRRRHLKTHHRSVLVCLLQAGWSRLPD